MPKGGPYRDPLQSAITAASRWSRITHLGVAVVLTAGLIALDMMTGPLISMAVFYLVPIGIVGWFTNRKWAVGLATICGFAWFWDTRELLGKDMPGAVILWQCVSRVGFFLAVAWMIGALRSMFDHQRALAETDDVTGVPNRRAFMAACEREISRSARFGTVLSAIYLDADYFKSINDRYGHDTGDRLLKVIAAVLVEHSRGCDFVARLGGDEFVVLLPEEDAEGAAQVAEKFRRLLNGAMEKRRWPVTFSMGVATFLRAPINPDELLRKADQLQYAAKHGGRDAVVSELIAA